MNIWIVGKDLMKHEFYSTLNLEMFQMMIMLMQLMYGTLLILVI